MKIKLIALDMDRTALNNQGTLSAENKRAIEAATAAGIHVVIASGRALSTLPEDVVACKGLEYAITLNGAAIYNLKTKELLYEATMEKDAVLQILNLTKDEPGLTYEAFFRGEAYASEDYFRNPKKYGAGSYAIEYVRRTRKPIEDIRQFLMEHAEVLNSMDLVIGDERQKERLYEKIVSDIPGVYVTSSIRQLIEISNAGGGKGTGVKLLSRRLGIAPGQIAAFGDADNDCDMLEYAGLGIAMANASPACKAAADKVTVSNEENGVAVALWEILEQAEKER